MNEILEKPTFHTLRIRAQATIQKISSCSPVSYSTANRADKGMSINEPSKFKMLNYLNTVLGTNYTVDDVAWGEGNTGADNDLLSRKRDTAN